MRPFDLAVIGGGIVGLAVARENALRGRRVVVLEAEERVAAHQTGHNSGVIHSGLYYRPGSLKAQNCVAGRDALYRFCAEQRIPHERCGKLVVATAPEEVERLERLERNGRANGLAGLVRLRGEELRRYEPHVVGVAGLWVPETGIVDFKEVAAALVRQLCERDGELRTGFRVSSVNERSDGLVVRSGKQELEARLLVACAGLQADRVARLCGVRPGVRIVPFRGDYYRLGPRVAGLVRNLIYPVPDPAFPFLGVHFTRKLAGGVECGPNAVLALAREGYRPGSVSARDLFEMLAFPGFWRMAARLWRTGLGELHRARSKAAFVAALCRLVPGIRADDLVGRSAGVRAQAVGPDGRLLDDFHILGSGRTLHVLNAPSPAATAALAIGETVAREAERRFGPP